MMIDGIPVTGPSILTKSKRTLLDDTVSGFQNIDQTAGHLPSNRCLDITIYGKCASWKMWGVVQVKIHGIFGIQGAQTR